MASRAAGNRPLRRRRPTHSQRRSAAARTRASRDSAIASAHASASQLVSNSRTYSMPTWSCISDDWRRGRATESERLSEAREACQSGESRDRIPSEPRRSIDGGDGGDKRGELSSPPLHRRTVIVKRKRREGGGEGVMALAAIMSSASICTRPALSGEVPPLPLTPPACSLRSVAAIITLSPFSCVEGKRRTHPESSGRSPMSGSAPGVSSLASSSDRTGGGAGVPGLITLVDMFDCFCFSTDYFLHFENSGEVGRSEEGR